MLKYYLYCWNFMAPSRWPLFSIIINYTCIVCSILIWHYWHVSMFKYVMFKCITDKTIWHVQIHNYVQMHYWHVHMFTCCAWHVNSKTLHYVHKFNYNPRTHRYKLPSFMRRCYYRYTRKVSTFHYLQSVNDGKESTRPTDSQRRWKLLPS